MRKYSNILSAVLLLIYVPTVLFLSVSHFHGVIPDQGHEIHSVSDIHSHAEFISEDSDRFCFICHFLNTQISADVESLSNPLYFASEAIEDASVYVESSPIFSFEVRGPPYLS